jgi:hypothetical protein
MIYNFYYNTQEHYQHISSQLTNLSSTPRTDSTVDNNRLHNHHNNDHHGNHQQVNGETAIQNGNHDQDDTILSSISEIQSDASAS